MTMADLSSVVGFDKRMRIIDDYETAKRCRETASFYRRYKLPGWRLDHRLELRRAIRHWRHYAKAVRAIQ